MLEIQRHLLAQDIAKPAERLPLCRLMRIQPKACHHLRPFLASGSWFPAAGSDLDSPLCENRGSTRSPHGEEGEAPHIRCLCENKTVATEQDHLN